MSDNGSRYSRRLLQSKCAITINQKSNVLQNDTTVTKALVFTYGRMFFSRSLIEPLGGKHLDTIKRTDY